MNRNYSTRNFSNDIESVKKFAIDYNLIFLNDSYMFDVSELINRYIIHYE
jgi:hypothetical protein